MGLFKHQRGITTTHVASLGVGEYLSGAEDKRITFLICAVCLGIPAPRLEHGEGTETR